VFTLYPLPCLFCSGLLSFLFIYYLFFYHFKLTTSQFYTLSSKDWIHPCSGTEKQATKNQAKEKKTPTTIQQPQKG
jgi:hypothetical protein